MTAGKTATVETVTAEVQVLMFGSRQITLSVFRQLDRAPMDDLDIFGRVRDPNAQGNWIDVIGRHQRTGALCRARLFLAPNKDHSQYLINHDGEPHWLSADEALPFIHVWDELERLPLIVLAGLR